MIIILKILAVLGLVFMNGFFVASEFALVKVRESRLLELAERGNLRAKVARSLLKNLDAYLSASQLGITLASLGLGWLGEPLVADQLRPALRLLGATSPAMISSLSVALGFILITFFLVVFGEQAPKFLAIRRVEASALWVAIPLRLFYGAFYPAIWLLNRAASATLLLLGIRAESAAELAHSEAELKIILSESARGGRISDQERKISQRALRLADFQVRQIMVPRNEIVYFSLADPLATSLAKAKANNYARYPICERDLDSSFGMVHLRDALWALHERGEVDLRERARQVLLVSEEDSLEAVLQRIRKEHIHLALVMDERGSVSGLITLEDILEQLVGPIQDEYDTESPLLKRTGPEAYEAMGRVPLTVLRDKLGIELEPDDAVTLSGYITSRLGRFPLTGDSLTLGDWRVTVTRTDAVRVKTCRIERELKSGQIPGPETPAH